MNKKTLRYILPLTLIMSLLLSVTAFADTSSPTADQSICVILQGARASAANGEPINYTLEQGGTTSNHSATTDENGCFEVATVGVGLYNLVIDGPDTLSTASAAVQLDGTDDDFRSGGTTITLREGDAETANTPNAVALADFSVLSGQFGSAGPEADFDENTAVNLTDFSILSGNFGQTGSRAADSARACGADTVVFTAGNAAVQPGGSGSVTVMAELTPDDSGLNAAQFSLTFDETLIQVDSIDRSGDFAINFVNQVDNTNGTVTYDIGAFSDVPVAGKTLITVNFTADAGAADGTTPIGWGADNQAFCGVGTVVPQGTHVPGTITIGDPTAVSVQSTGSATMSALPIITLLVVVMLSSAAVVVAKRD